LTIALTIATKTKIIDALLAEDFRRSMHYLSEEELERTLSL